MSLLYMCIIFAITIVLVHGRAVWEWGVGLDEGGLFAGQPKKKKKDSEWRSPVEIVVVLT